MTTFVSFTPYKFSFLFASHCQVNIELQDPFMDGLHLNSFKCSLVMNCRIVLFNVWINLFRDVDMDAYQE